jgi:CubicO group peptidase (beta-lactamase class C family)
MLSRGRLARIEDEARRVLSDAIAAAAFPAATVDVGTSAGTLWQDGLGTLTFDDTSPPVTLRTPFDLASLTKAIATTSVIMQLVRDSHLRLDEPVASFFPEWRGTDRDRTTVQDLLEHASGLSARLIDSPPHGRREFEHDICAMPLEYAPRTQSIYSDLGFILLGFGAADRGRATLAAQFESIVRALGHADSEPATDPLAFELNVQARRLAAPTMPLGDDARLGKLLVGEVHDSYAAALGGIAGHAGLFGTAPAVGAFARAVLRAARGDESVAAPLSPALLAQFLVKSMVPGSSRALGWDTMLPTSSCGSHMSVSAFGHVGFTGTSLWIDPARDRYFVLLTNRACGGGSLDQMRTVRRAFHDALADI